MTRRRPTHPRQTCQLHEAERNRLHGAPRSRQNHSPQQRRRAGTMQRTFDGLLKQARPTACLNRAGTESYPNRFPLYLSGYVWFTMIRT
jgi:hypothetical protein